MRYLIKEFTSAGGANVYLQKFEGDNREIKKVQTSIVPYGSYQYKIVLTIAYEDNFVGDFIDEEDGVVVL